MPDKETNINYTIDDIERYLNGSMGAKEMHEIELAALKDPFLADAIEGYSESNFQTSYEHLNQINAALYKKREETSIIPITPKRYSWWNAAAMVAVIVITGAITWYLVRLNDSTEIGEKKEIKHVPIAGNQSAELKTDTVIPEHDTIPVIAQLRKEKSVSPVEKKVIKDERPTVKYNSDEDLRIVINKKTEEKDTTQTEKMIAPDYVTIPSLNQPIKENFNKDLKHGGNIQSAAKPSEIVYNGRVTDNNNRSVSGALIIAPGAKTTTDNRGYFSFRSKDSLVNVTVSSIGYEEIETKLKGNVANNITMKPDEQTLSEVVVSAFDTQKKSGRQLSKQKEVILESNKKKELLKKAADSSLKSTVDSSTSYPSVGWESFQEYVYKQLNLERDTVWSDVNVSRDVELEFTIDDDGLPVNFKVLKSLGPTPDNKAIDIVKKGPKWIPGKKNKTAKVTITF